MPIELSDDEWIVIKRVRDDLRATSEKYTSGETEAWEMLDPIQEAHAWLSEIIEEAESAQMEIGGDCE